LALSAIAAEAKPAVVAAAPAPTSPEPSPA
jgi:hypothetical protein